MGHLSILFHILMGAALVASRHAIPAARLDVQATRTAVPVPHRVMMPAVDLAPSARAGSQGELETRQCGGRGGSQIPFQFCPEFWGNPPKACSECGGDSKFPGRCDRILVSGQQRCCQSDGNGCVGYFCECIPDKAPDSGPRVTMTTVIDGETGTVVWEPMTLSQYANLKSKTTVTLTELATTTSSGEDELETVVAAVFAGGIAWWIASQSGAVGAALAIPPPQQPPDGSKEDDKICKSNPKEECKDCGGADAVGLCQSGDEAGCPCDVVQHCPNEPPKCSDPQCGGDNGQSQCSADGDGEIKDCLCCPEETAQCADDVCKGDENAVCQADSRKGCACEWVFDAQPVDVDDDDISGPSNQELSSNAAMVFTSVWSGDRKSVPGFVPESSSNADLDCATVTATKGTTIIWQGRETQTYCQCGVTRVDMHYATSDTATTSWCDPWALIPDGYTYYPADDAGNPITLFSPTPPPPPSTTITSSVTEVCTHGYYLFGYETSLCSKETSTWTVTITR